MPMVGFGSVDKRVAIAILALAAGSIATDKPGATVVARVIFRDSETLKDIRRTGSTALEKGKAYRLVVIKSRYRLNVFEGERLVKAYPIALGGSPSGPKQQARDQKTPEGDYTLVPHYPSPGYGECFYIRFPPDVDPTHGLARGLV